METFAEHPEIVGASEIDLEKRHQTAPDLPTTRQSLLNSSKELFVCPSMRSYSLAVVGVTSKSVTTSRIRLMFKVFSSNFSRLRRRR